MLFKKRKTEEFHFTPEQEACLANCRQLSNDELRILNGGGSYKGMPSSVQMQQGLSGGSSNNNSSSSSGTSASKGHNGMPSDVEAMLEHSGSSSVTETSSSVGQTTVTTVAYPAQPATQPSEPKPVASEPAVNHGTGSASGSGSTDHSSTSTSSNGTGQSSPSGNTPGSCAGNGSEPFPKPYAGAYEHGSYAEAQRGREEQKIPEVQDESDNSEICSGGQITINGSADEQKRVLKDINALSYAQYQLTEDGRLVKTKKINPRGSKTYSRIIDAGINDSLIPIYIKEVDAEKIRAFGKEHSLVENGNGLTLLFQADGEEFAVKSYYNGHTNETIGASRCEILMHELAGHAIPQAIGGMDYMNAVVIENFIRYETNSSFRPYQGNHYVRY